MKKNLVSLLLILLSSAMKGFNPYRRASLELAHLKMSLFYIKCLRNSRLAIVGLLGIGACLVLFAIGLMLFHATLFLYAPWSATVKMVVGFSFTALYFLITGLGVSYVLSPEKWLRVCRAERLINDLEKEISVEPSSSEGIKGRKNGNKHHKETAEPYQR